MTVMFSPLTTTKPRSYGIFFISLIGTPANTSWAFDLNAIYPQPVAGLHVLDENFSEDEIKLAFFPMNPRASPGPDGFGPSFYRTY